MNYSINNMNVKEEIYAGGIEHKNKNFSFYIPALTCMGFVIILTTFGMLKIDFFNSILFF